MCPVQDIPGSRTEAANTRDSEADAELTCPSESFTFVFAAVASHSTRSPGLLGQDVFVVPAFRLSTCQHAMRSLAPSRPIEVVKHSILSS